MRCTCAVLWALITTLVNCAHSALKTDGAANLACEVEVWFALLLLKWSA